MPKPANEFRLQTTIPSLIHLGHQQIERVLHELTERDWEGDDLFAVRMALEEALVNAIKHGNASNTAKQVRLECRGSAEKVWIQITDEGAGFNPARVPDCTLAQHLDSPSGRGVHLMRCFMNRVEFLGNGNVVVMEKLRNHGTKPPCPGRP